MRILLISPWLPNITGGASTRTFHLLKGLSLRHDLTLLSFVQPHEEAMVSEIKQFCQRTILLPFAGFPSQRKWANRLQGWARLLISSRPQLARTYPTSAMCLKTAEVTAATHFDLVQVESLMLAEVRGSLPDMPTVLNTQNVEHVILRRQQQTADGMVHSLRDRIATARLAAYEREWTQRFDVCLAVSPDDAQVLGTMLDPDRVWIVPNGVDCDYFASTPYPDTPKTCDLVFVGTMHYQPNVDAVTFFCRNVLPLIRRDLPEIRLTIVGSRPVAKVLELASLPGVSVTGYVPDVRPYYWHSKLSIVPLRIGGGTRLKILESLAAGCAVLSTSIGAEGLNLQHGTHLLLADTPELFADSVVRLLIDPLLRERLARQGQIQVCQEYGWSGIVSHLDTAYEKIVDEYHRTQG